MTRIAVVSPSFARNDTLRAELSARHPDATFTETADVVSGDALIALLRGHDSAIVGLERIDDEVLAKVPELRVVSKYGVGLDGIDIEAMTRRGVKLAWTGGTNRRSVAELTVGFAIALLHRVPEADLALRKGQFRKWVGRQLTGRTFGIIGCGFVGQDLVKLLAPFECRVLAHDIRDYDEFYRAHDVAPVSLDQLLQEADIVSLHVPLTPATRHLIGAEALRLMRPDAYLINTCRGPVVDEAALVEALGQGVIAGAGLDVFDQEPPAADNPLFRLPNVNLTPHFAGPTWDNQQARFRNAFDNCQRVARGDRPLWVIPELAG